MGSIGAQRARLCCVWDVQTGVGSQSDAWATHAVEYLQLRSVALYLLMAFIGGQAQSLYAVQSFVKRALRCYR